MATRKAKASPSPRSGNAEDATTTPPPGRKAAKLAKPEAIKLAKPAARKPSRAGKAAASKVKDRFSMPAADYALIAQLKQRAAASGRKCKKSELLRAGLRQLAELDPLTLCDLLDRLATPPASR